MTRALSQPGSVLCVDEIYGYDATLGCALLELSGSADYRGPPLCGISLCPQQLYSEGDHQRIAVYTQTQMRNYGVSLWKSSKLLSMKLPAPPSDTVDAQEQAKQTAPSLNLHDYSILKPLGTSGVMITPLILLLC